MNIDFSKGDGLVPVIVQHEQTGCVLMLGYMNEPALAETRRSGRVTFYSRSKQRLWTKGETSKNYLTFIDVRVDCDSDALLVLAKPEGPTCHMGTKSCFGDDAPEFASFLSALEEIIKDRQANPIAGSYTASLFEKGIKKIAQKVGEEGVEVALEGVVGDTEKLKEEASDLLYHLLVLLVSYEIPLADVLDLLETRNN